MSTKAVENTTPSNDDPKEIVNQEENELLEEESPGGGDPRHEEQNDDEEDPDDEEDGEDEDVEDDYEYEYEDDDAPTVDEAMEQALALKVDALNNATPEALAMKQVEQSDEATPGQRRLAKDMYRILKNNDTDKAGFRMEPASEDSMQVWRIELFGFDADSDLAKDLHVLGLDSILLNMRFPDQYPHEPPFVHVVTPRFERRTGHVFDGALCMELLTKSGWNPINDIESVIVSIRSLMVVGRGRLTNAVKISSKEYAARLKKGRNEADKPDKSEHYTESTAKQALQSVERIHKADWAK